ncbi:hypothetical protein [uncultured Aeromicrobium sp.]|uniref:hypothetical protein n=1 Tax=uncultured Aeromicrobium sp. TaxID=337820 RepID=UPI0025E94E64|nr:hypothetical protein [uncultured Aeromicrobium sp.]
MKGRPAAHPDQIRRGLFRLAASAYQHGVSEERFVEMLCAPDSAAGRQIDMLRSTRRGDRARQAIIREQWARAVKWVDEHPWPDYKARAARCLEPLYELVDLDLSTLGLDEVDRIIIRCVIAQCLDEDGSPVGDTPVLPRAATLAEIRAAGLTCGTTQFRKRISRLLSKRVVVQVHRGTQAADPSERRALRIRLQDPDVVWPLVTKAGGTVPVEVELSLDALDDEALLAAAEAHLAAARARGLITPDVSTY